MCLQNPITYVSVRVFGIIEWLSNCTGPMLLCLGVSVCGDISESNIGNVEMPWLSFPESILISVGSELEKKSALEAENEPSSEAVHLVRTC
jgi:hypothetical protein